MERVFASSYETFSSRCWSHVCQGSVYCRKQTTGKLDTMVGIAASFENPSDTINKTANLQVEEMVRNIKNSFRENLHSVEWMDEITRQRARDKVTNVNINLVIGNTKRCPDN